MQRWTLAGGIAVAGICAALASEAAAQDFNDQSGRYLDQYNLPGVRTNPPEKRAARCVERQERVIERYYPEGRLTTVLVCNENGLTTRSTGSWIPTTPYGVPPVGGYSGLGGADTR